MIVHIVSLVSLSFIVLSSCGKTRLRNDPTAYATRSNTGQLQVFNAEGPKKLMETSLIPFKSSLQGVTTITCTVVFKSLDPCNKKRVDSTPQIQLIRQKESRLLR